MRDTNDRKKMSANITPITNYYFDAAISADGKRAVTPNASVLTGLLETLGRLP
jgi:hypothetical protein